MEIEWKYHYFDSNDRIQEEIKNMTAMPENQEIDLDDDHDNIQAILTYFQGSGNPPNLFFKDHTWILYIYGLICLHGFVMNTFLVSK